MRCAKENSVKIAGFFEERGGTVLRFSLPVVPVFINTIMKYSGDRNEVRPILESPFRQNNQNCLKVNEIEPLKTEKVLELSLKSPGISFSCFCMNPVSSLIMCSRLSGYFATINR